MPIEQKRKQILSVSEVVQPYLRDYSLSHRESSIRFAEAKLQNIVRLMGAVLLTDLTEDRIRHYMRERQAEGVCGRTINAELGELSRAMGHEWKILWPKVRKLEERRDVGKALSPTEQAAILHAAAQVRSPVVRTMVPVLLLTGMRPGEAAALTWGQVNLFDRVIAVGRAKTSSGTGRQIPIK